jgi:VanZ family protein
MAFIFALSSIREVPQLPAGSDKNLHAILYAGLAALVARALAGGWRRRLTLPMALGTIVICAVYGITDEVHQYFVPPRQADILDVVADAAGAAAAALGLLVWSGIIRQRDRPRERRERREPPETP